MANEKRLIDANELLRDAEDYAPIRGGLADMYDIKWLVDAQITVDAVEVVHGQIIETIENGKMKRVFSCCNTDFTQMTMWITPNYCPNCGAKMDGERKDNV